MGASSTSGSGEARCGVRRPDRQTPAWEHCRSDIQKQIKDFFLKILQKITFDFLFL